MAELFVNIDHVCTLRNQRGTDFPDPVECALLCQKAGACGITVHLREDRRHIKDADVYNLKKSLNIKLNLEMAVTDEMVKIALDVKPDFCCLVPEKREELTTEGGLDVVKHFNRIKDAVTKLQEKNIIASLFIEPDFKQIDASYKAGAKSVEFHTGHYANLNKKPEEQKQELEKINKAIDYAHSLGLKSNVGHGLDYTNTQSLAINKKISEFNTGHSIICHSVYWGLFEAVKKMKKICEAN